MLFRSRDRRFQVSFGATTRECVGLMQTAIIGPRISPLLTINRESNSDRHGCGDGYGWETRDRKQPSRDRHQPGK